MIVNAVGRATVAIPAEFADGLDVVCEFIAHYLPAIGTYSMRMFGCGVISIPCSFAPLSQAMVELAADDSRHVVGHPFEG